MSKFPSSSTLALAVGALGSGAANVAWTWELGPVRVAAGVFATALVPISLHMWPRVPVTGRPTKVIRALVMGYICLAAALVNLAHSAQLLTVDLNMPRAHTEDVWLAILLITAVEAVMVMATLAKRAPKTKPAVSAEQLSLVLAVAQMAGAVRPASKTRARRDERSTSVGSATTPETKQHRVSAGETAREWAVRNWPCTGAEVQLATKVKKASAYRIVRQLREEMAS